MNPREVVAELYRRSEFFESGGAYEAGKSTAYGNAAELLERVLNARCRQPECELMLNHDDGVHSLDRVRVGK